MSSDSDVIRGVNGHPLSQEPYLGMSVEQQMQDLQSMGLTSYCVDISLENFLPTAAHGDGYFFSHH